MAIFNVGIVLCYRAWIARRDKLDQCLELQLFNRDCEQAETWMAAREASLEDSVDGSGDSVEALLKKHEDFDRAIASQEEKISAINELANKVGDHAISMGPIGSTNSQYCTQSKFAIRMCLANDYSVDDMCNLS